MIDTVSIAKEIVAGSKRISKASKEIFILAEKKAETERDYRIALTKEIIKLREEGMAIGMIQDVARGNVADLKYERDVADVTYTAGRDSIKAIQSELSALQSILRTQEEI